MKNTILIALPFALLTTACSDSVAPTWGDDSEVALSVDENALVVAWPEASDDKAVTQYRVVVDGTPGVEAGGEARNWKAREVTLGEDHEIAVVALDAAGNESKPLTASWKGQDLDGPTWPIGSVLKVKAAEPAPQGEKLAADGPRKLRITWPEATDPSGVAFYRVLHLPDAGSDVVRPRLVGVVKAEDDDFDLETEGTARDRFQVYAVDVENNSSEPIKGSLINPTVLNPLKQIKATRVGSPNALPPVVDKKPPVGGN